MCRDGINASHGPNHICYFNFIKYAHYVDDGGGGGGRVADGASNLQ